jgi:hypothetical protein
MTAKRRAVDDFLTHRRVSLGQDIQPVNNACFHATSIINLATPQPLDGA